MTSAIHQSNCECGQTALCIPRDRSEHDRDKAIRKLARAQWERDGEIEFADNAVVSEGEGNEVNGA